MNENKTNINWYPGHMAKTKREISEKIKLIDIVYEVIDARIPLSSKIKDIDELIGNKPKILILDEPTNGLDPVGIKNILNMLKSMKDTTIIISSHLLSEIELFCNRLIFINNGEIVNIKYIDNNSSKKNIMFEVDDYSKARIILNNYCINEELEVYEDDDTVSKLNKKLLDNNINVYRIYENKNSLESEFFKMVNND